MKWHYPNELQKVYREYSVLSDAVILQNQRVQENVPSLLQLEDVSYSYVLPPVIADIPSEAFVGDLTIPSVAIQLPLTITGEPKHLQGSAAIISTPYQWGQGNITIIGRSASSKNILFTNLRGIEIGAEIHIHDRQVIYSYEVEKRLHIRANRTDLLLERDYPTLTLVTALKESTEQLAVRAKYIGKDVIK